MYDFLIVGAGFSGAVLAERLASQMNKKVAIIDRRNHIGGNSFDYIDDKGILVHKYGPHWFHTNDDKVFSYLSKFTEWFPHKHIVKTNVDGDLYPFPINRTTLNKFFGITLKSDVEAKEFLEKQRIIIENPRNAEEMVLSLVGKRLYEKFYKNYTIKQWRKSPAELDPSITARIPIRYNTEESYFNDKIQAMPFNGYAKLFEKMMADKNIEVILNADFFKEQSKIKFKKLIYTGAIDEYYNYCFGQLPYRSLRFEHYMLDKELFQPCQQVNYPNENSFTRIIEWKHVLSTKNKTTSIMKEYPEEFNGANERYYPILTQNGKELYQKYAKKSKKEKNVYFIGRLAEFKYYNMDQVVASALKLFDTISKS